MSLLQMLSQVQGGQGLGQLGQALGLDAATTEALAGKLAPAISSGMKARASQEGGLGAILGQLKGEASAGYFDNPAAAAAPEAQAAGADFLAQIFGDQNAAPQLAEAAAEQAGVSADQAQQLLPALAAMLQGGMQRAAPDAEIETAAGGIASAGLDKAGAGLGDLMGALGGSGGSGGILGGLMGALGGGGSGGGGLGGMLGALTGGGGGGGGAQGGLGSVLQMLDADGDGSPLDDIVGRFLK